MKKTMMHMHMYMLNILSQRCNTIPNPTRKRKEKKRIQTTNKNIFCFNICNKYGKDKKKYIVLADNQDPVERCVR